MQRLFNVAAVLYIMIYAFEGVLEGLVAGDVDYIQADVRDTAGLLARAGRTLDLCRPVALLLVSVLHMVCDHDDPHAAVARLVAALPGGSYLVLTIRQFR